MERRENALVAPAAVFVGLTVAAVFGAVVWFVFRDDDDEPTFTGNGETTEPPQIDPPVTGEIGDATWNTSVDGTKKANVQAGQVYTSNVMVPVAWAGGTFSVNVTPENLGHAVGEPQISNLPNVGAAVPVTFTPQTSGSIELVWPEGAVPGEQILNFYRRLDFVVSGGGGTMA